MKERTDERQPRVLTPKETAVELRMGLNQVYAAIKSGDIPSIRIGRKILVPAVGIDRLLGGA